MNKEWRYFVSYTVPSVNIVGRCQVDHYRKIVDMYDVEQIEKDLSLILHECLRVIITNFILFEDDNE